MLKEHIDPATGDLDPQYSWGPDCIEFLEGVLHWELLPIERWLYVKLLEMGPGGVGFAYEGLDVLATTIVPLPPEQARKWSDGRRMWLEAARCCNSRLCGPSDCRWKTSRTKLVPVGGDQ